MSRDNFDYFYSKDLSKLRTSLLSRARSFTSSLKPENYIDLYYEVDALCVVFLDEETGEKKIRRFGLKDC